MVVTGKDAAVDLGSFPTTAIRMTLRLSRVVARDPRCLPFLPAYIQSFRTGHTGVADEQPSVTFRAREWLIRYLSRDMSVFEYGTGGSTLFFARRVRSVVSVEHHKEWYTRFSGVVRDRRIHNCKVILCEPAPLPTDSRVAYYPGSFTSADPRYRDLSFERYVRAIDGFPDANFDLVLVDGRSRSTCLLYAVRKIKPLGCLMLDNSDREEYGAARDLLRRYPRTDFSGIGPYVESPWITSMWRISPGQAS